MSPSSYGVGACEPPPETLLSSCCPGPLSGHSLDWFLPCRPLHWAGQLMIWIEWCCVRGNGPPWAPGQVPAAAVGTQRCSVASVRASSSLRTWGPSLSRFSDPPPFPWVRLSFPWSPLVWPLCPSVRASSKERCVFSAPAGRLPQGLKSCVWRPSPASLWICAAPLAAGDSLALQWSHQALTSSLAEGFFDWW